MRHVWVRAAFRLRLLGVALLGGLSLTALGCHQHYYYYGDQCAPGTAMPSSVRTGPVCDVPTQVDGGGKLADGTNRATVVTGASSSGTSSRVVVSEPSEPAKVAWRRSDPEGGVATTSVQGTVNDAAINRQ